MNLNDFSLLSPDQKVLHLIFKGALPLGSGNPDLTYKLYFYKKFYFEEVLDKSGNVLIEAKAVRKFDEFKKYLSAIRLENFSQ